MLYYTQRVKKGLKVQKVIVEHTTTLTNYWV